MDKEKIIYAPWRIEYIKNSKKEKGCILCKKPKENYDTKNLILEKSKKTFVIMNLYPYNCGHLMIAPYRHTNKLENLKENEYTEILKLAQLWIKILKKLIKPPGFNLGMNLGKIAGAGIDKHLHLHIVPRWNGDTNFMPVIANTKVMSENLNQTYKNLFFQRFKKKPL